MLRTIALALATIGLAGCGDEPVLDTPDLDAIVDDYENPDAELDAAQVEQIIAAARSSLSATYAAGGFDFIVAWIDETKRGLEERGLDGALGAAIEGHATIHAGCPGYDAGAVQDDARDGFIELATPIDRAALGPVAFGFAERCRTGQSPALPSWLPPWQAPFRAELNGDVAIHFGQPLAFGSAITPTPILRIDGTLQIAGLPTLSAFDVRAPAPGVAETRVVLPDGTNAVLAISATSLSLRERRGTWLCQVQGGMACAAGF